MNIEKLDQRDRDVLAYSYHRASSSVTALASALGIRAHTARRVLQRLEEQKIISRKAFIDIYRLGYTQFELFYAIAAARPAASRSFLQSLVRSRRVAWIGEYSGEYQYVVTVCCRHPHELMEFVQETSGDSRVSVVNRQLAVRVRYTEFPLHTLSKHVSKDRPIAFGTLGNVAVDRADHELLRTLSDSSDRSTRDLARQLSLSQSAVQQRISRLTREKVLAGDTFVIDFSRLGLQAYSILLRTKTHTDALTTRMLDYAARRPGCAYLAESLGAYDYKFGVLLESPAMILPFSQELSEAFSDEISSLTTLTAFDYRKVSRYPF